MSELPSRSAQEPDRDVSQNHYWSYHQIEKLLSCKEPLTASQDEDLFIAVHQICELAFHQMILDLDRTLDALVLALQVADAIVGDTQEAGYFLDRVLALWETVNGTMPVLRSMRAFAEFRSSIGPTSGFQSFQFRRIEIMSGVAVPYWRGGTNNAEGKPHLAEVEFDRCYGEQVRGWFERYREHNLALCYHRLIERGSNDWQRLWTYPPAGTLLKKLAAYESAQTRFHQLHLSLAAQQLERVGAIRGTGGTAFAAYLKKYSLEVTPLFPGLARSNSDSSGALA